MSMEAVGPMEGPTAWGSPAGAECRSCTDTWHPDTAVSVCASK